MVEEQIILNNLLVSYFKIENAGQGCLLFLHGWRSNKEAWSGITNRILDIGYSILAIDLPGFGKSETPKQAMGVGDYAEVVAEFIRKLELHQVVIVGHSFGGRVGIKLAARHPELISKLVLVDSAGFAESSSKKKVYEHLAKIVKPIFKHRVMQPLRKKIYQSIGAEDYVATPELQQTFINVVKEDLTKDLEQVRQPTLIIWGRGDKDTPLRFAEKMHAIIPQSSLAILEHAGHFSFIDQPEKFVEVVKKFIL